MGGADEEVEDVVVDQCDFWTALQELHPSLSVEELARYDQIRMQYEGRV